MTDPQPNPVQPRPVTFVVEDYAPSLESLRMVLEKTDHHAEYFPTLKAAAYRCAETLPDILIIEWSLEDGEGMQLCQRIRRRIGGEYVVVIMMTGRTEAEALRDALESGVDHYLVKPFSLDELTFRLTMAEEMVQRQRRRRLQDQRLRRSNEELEATYRGMVERSPNAIFILHEGAVIFANPRVRDLLGDPPGAFLGADLTERIQPRDRSAFRADLDSCLEADRDPVPFELRLARRDGAEVIVEASMGRIDYGGRPAVLLILHDITGRKHAEEALQASEQRMRYLAEAAQAGIAIHEAGVLRDANEQFFAMLGYPPEELLGKYMLQRCLAGADLEEARRRMSTNEFAAYEADMIRKDGTRLRVRILPRPLQYRGRAARGVVVLDIQREHDARKALAESNRRRETLEAIIDASPVIGLRWRLTEGWPVLFVSENIRELGYTSEDFYRGRIDYREIIHPDDVARVASEVSAHMAEPGCTEFWQEYRLRRADGGYRYVVDRTRLERDEMGRGVVAQGVLLDATERIEARRALEEQQALAMRSDRLRSLGDMAGSLAHEFTQPLSGIRGFAENILIAKQRGWPTTDEALMEKMEAIIEQTSRITDLIDHIRGFANQAGEAECVPTTLGLVVQDTLTVTGAQLRSRSIAVEVRDDLDGLQVIANPFSVEEILLNLLRNARDAILERRTIEPTAPATIQVRLYLEECSDAAAGRFAVVEVADTGIGLDDVDEGRLFEPFYTTKSPEKGAGLGLSVAYQAAQWLGGDLRLEANPEGGATARLLLPADGGSCCPECRAEAPRHKQGNP